MTQGKGNKTMYNSNPVLYMGQVSWPPYCSMVYNWAESRSHWAGWINGLTQQKATSYGQICSSVWVLLPFNVGHFAFLLWSIVNKETELNCVRMFINAWLSSAS